MPTPLAVKVTTPAPAAENVHVNVVEVPTASVNGPGGTGSVIRVTSAPPGST